MALLNIECCVNIFVYMCKLFISICFTSTRMLCNNKVFRTRYQLKKCKNIIFSALLMISLIYLQFIVFENTTYFKRLTTPTPPIGGLNKLLTENVNTTYTRVNKSLSLKIPSEIEFRMNWIKNKIEKITKHSKKWDIKNLLSNTGPVAQPSDRVHIFYYASYGNLEIDSEWKQWNQEYSFENVPKDISYKGTLFSPPLDIASNYYPLLGCYSSNNKTIISTHFKQIRDTGIGVVVISWFPQVIENKSNDNTIHFLNEANKHNLKVTLHLEVRLGQNVTEFSRTISFIAKNYISHPAFYKIRRNGRHLPVFYVYESHLIPASEWRKLLSNRGSQSIRGTPYDGIFIGLLLNKRHRYEIEKAHFDGFYSYFSSNGLSYGSSWKNWKTLQQFAKKNKLLFFPSISPGYSDTKVRPWNNALTRHRSRGHYYQVAWRSAISIKPEGVSITSFNKWQDGSQIEPAQPKVIPEFTYLDYEPEGPLFYLNLTRYWVKQFVITNNYSIEINKKN